MTQVASYTAINHSRLIRFLTELQVVDKKPDLERFADKLGALIGLADSMTLFEALGDIKRTPFEAKLGDDKAVKEDCLEVRANLVESIAKSFVADSATLSLNLPVTLDDSDKGKDAELQGLLRLYSIHQSDMEYQLHKLRIRVRKAVQAKSERLAQLVALDTVLSETLADHSRGLLTVIPKLLAVRYKQLNQPVEGDALPVWKSRFYDEMKGLLLAELDFRMQPILGLIEALEEEV